MSTNITDIGAHALYDNIYAVIEEHHRKTSDIELNLNTVDEITQHVEEYITGRLNDFYDSVNQKTLDERLYAAIASEFDVSPNLFGQGNPCSSKETLALHIAYFIQRECFAVDIKDNSLYEYIKRKQTEDKEFAGHILNIRKAVGIANDDIR